MSNNNGDGWDTFDWASWGEAPSADGRTNSANGTHGKLRSEVTHMGRDYGDERRTSFPTGDDEDAPGEFVEGQQEGRWVSQGGILTWEEPEGRATAETEGGLRAEVDSHWAAEDVDLPPGTPDAIRIRAAHAWLARQRALEAEAVGVLLLERRKLEQGTASDDEELPPQRATDDQGGSALDLAVIEHQTAIETYDSLIETLDDLVNHTGPARVLVEFYLWVTERLAAVAAMPEAPAGFAERVLLIPVEDEENARPSAAQPTPRSTAEWQGSADALLQTRRRLEWVTAPDPAD